MLKGQVQLQLGKGIDRTKEEDHHLARMTFRELWDKWASDRIIWLCMVQIAQGEEVDEGERFSGQIWKQKGEKNAVT